MFWICAGNSTGNFRDVLVTAEQHLQRSKAFSASHPSKQAGGAQGAGRGHGWDN